MLTLACLQNTLLFPVFEKINFIKLQMTLILDKIIVLTYFNSCALNIALVHSIIEIVHTMITK